MWKKTWKFFDLHWNLNKTPIKHTITSQPNFKLHTNEPITQIQQSYNNRPKTNKYNVFKSLAPTRNKKYFTFFVQRYLYAVFSCSVVAIACQRHNMRTPIVLQQNDSMCKHHVIRLLETDQLLRNIELKEKERERNKMKKKKRSELAIKLLFGFVPLRVSMKWSVQHLSVEQKKKATSLEDWSWTKKHFVQLFQWGAERIAREERYNVMFCVYLICTFMRNSAKTKTKIENATKLAKLHDSMS